MASPTTPPPWRPRTQSSAAAHSRQLFIVIAVAVAIGGATLFAFARAASRKPEKVNLGSHVFVINGAARKETQSPLFFNDLVRDSQPLPIVVNAVGPKQWVALNAVPPNSTVRCAVRWDRTRRVLVDPCAGTLYAPDGRNDGGPSLIRYKLTLTEMDRLEIDLNTKVR